MSRRWGCTRLTVVALLAFLPASAAVAQGQPDEPYRYVSAPAGSPATKPPTSGRAVLHVYGGQTQMAYVNTGEIGPQLSLYIPPGALVARRATRVVVTVQALAPARPLPANGTIDSNVYRVAANADNGRPVTVRHPLTVQLRSPAEEPAGTITAERRVGERWLSMPTVRVADGGLWQASVPSLGEWALVQVHAKCIDACEGHERGSTRGGLLVLITAVAVLAAALLAGLLRAAWVRRKA